MPGQSAQALYFRYRNLRWGSRSYSWLAPQDLLGAEARHIVRGLLRFHREMVPALARGITDIIAVDNLSRAPCRRLPRAPKTRLSRRADGPDIG